MREMKYPRFSMCVHFRDTDFCQKMSFESKNLALDWFETFKQINKRPVTITFYCGLAPYWVYRYEKSDS